MYITVDYFFCLNFFNLFSWQAILCISENLYAKITLKTEKKIVGLDLFLKHKAETV